MMLLLEMLLLEAALFGEGGWRALHLTRLVCACLVSVGGGAGLVDEVGGAALEEVGVGGRR